MKTAMRENDLSRKNEIQRTSVKIYYHISTHSQHNEKSREITNSQLQLKHELEVHAIDSDNEGQRDEDGGNDSQYLHDFIHSVAKA